MGNITYDNDNFYKDGKKHVILAGAMQYFRIPREYWYDRLLKLKECGFNTVETYTCWNLHEPREGEFNFSGNLDVVKYIETAKELGLDVILRPGPYICAEMD
ncbi:MAG: beta-galactosidase, partial [Clostridia bacterium]|nr:beta-galactosidase [Clostridia bacterium]